MIHTLVPKEAITMKRIQFIVLLLTLLMLTGCGTGADIPFSESNAPLSAAIEEDSDKLSTAAEAAFQEVKENTKEDGSNSPETGADEKSVTAENKQTDDGETDTAAISSSQPVTDQNKDPASEGSKQEEEAQEPHDSEQEPETESKPEKGPEQEQPVDPPPEASENESDPAPEAESEEKSETEPETDSEPAFDIDYWISYARSTATGLGLEFDSSAVDCWDDPITANPDCIYLERDITARLSRYARDEDITAVWIWYESVGTNKYLIYIGYA